MRAQEMASGLLVASVSIRTDQDIHSRDRNDYDVPLGLSIPICGRMGWSDSRGHRQELRAGTQFHWYCGQADCADSLLHAGDSRFCHIAVPREILANWLGDKPGKIGERRMRHCLDATAGTRSPMHSLPISHTMRQTAARLLTLQTAATTPMPLAQRILIEGLALTMLGEWLELPETPRDTTAIRHRQAIDEAIDILDQEFSHPISIATLARRVGINECYLKRGFKRRTGMGVAAYLRRRRMQAAADLLEEGGSTIGEVARHVGYSSLGHFARAFLDMHGRLPSEVASQADMHGRN